MASAKDFAVEIGDSIGEELKSISTASTTSLASTGQCGDNVYWTFDKSTGLLTISGTGKMTDYSSCFGLYYWDTPFSGNDVKSVIISEGVTSIGNYAFGNCPKLTNVTMADSVKSIGSYSFTGCKSLYDLTIGSGVTSIDKFAFHGLEYIKQFNADEDNICFSSDSNGVLFNKDKTELIKYPRGNDSESYIIPDGVKIISDYAFDRIIDNLKSVIIPDSVKNIGNWAFNYSYIEKIKGCAGLTQIGQYAFSGCYRLNEIDIPDSVAEIGEYAFGGCSSLKNINIPKNLTSISNNTFDGCKSLTDVTLPKGLVNIGDWAFGGCSSLSNIIMPDSVKTIGASAFGGCAFTNITIPNSVISIGSYAFSFCDNLINITIPDNVTDIGSNIFSYSEKLQNVTLGRGINNIPENAFLYCENFSSIVIPDNVKSIGDWAFGWCKKLTSVTIGSGLENIGYEAFVGCFELTDFKVSENNLFYCNDKDGVLYNKNKTKLICYPENNPAEAYSIPDTIMTIDSETFSNCENLISIKIGNGVTSIGDGAFHDCGNLTYVAMGNSVKTIGKGAFESCNFNRIDIPDSVTSIGQSAFSSCDNLTDLTIGNGVTTISRYAFSRCTKITNIFIPNCVKKIDSQAFDYCTALESITIMPSVEEIGSRAFQYCDLMTINAYSDSYAAFYAIENGYKLNLINDDYSDNDNLFLDRSMCSYMTAAVGKLSASGTADMTVSYGFKGSVEDSVSDLKTLVYLPKGTEIISETVRDNRNIKLDCSEKNGWLTVPVTSKSGAIKFSVKPTKVTDLLSYATISFKSKGSNHKETIGVLCESLNIVTISAKDFTTESEVYVSGLAEPSSNVNICVDGELQKTVSANKAGDYSATVALDDVSDGKRYTVTATVSGDDSLAKTTVTYKKDVPELEKLDLYYNYGKNPTQVYPESDITPFVSFLPGRPFTFKAKISNSEDIENVCITSTRNGVKKYMDAKYDEDSGQFVASGFFDEKNHSYVPGMIGVEYQMKHEEPYISEDVDLLSIYNQMPDTYKNTKVKVLNDTPTSKTVEVDLSEILKETVDTTLKISINQYEGESGKTYLSDTYGVISDTIEWVKVIKEDDSEEFQLLKKDSTSFEKAEAFVYIINDVSKDTYTELIIKAADYGGNEVAIDKAINFIGNVGYITDAAKVIFKAKGIEKEKEELDKEILETVPFDKVDEALKKSQELADDKVDFLLVTTVLPLFVKAIGVTGAAGLLFSGIIALMVACSSFFWDYRTANILGGTAKINFAIDPSGFVYEGTEDNRLEGVTATAYCIESDGSDTFFDKKPSENEYGTKWNALEYSQANPLVTDIDGRYAWDVPEGWWRVKYEKKGYETTWSDWLPVPPPQTEVNIEMKPGESNPQYLLSFDANGGSVTPTCVTVESGETVVLPTPYKEGYSCLGWSTNKEELNVTFQCGSNYEPTTDITLYAVWKRSAQINSVSISDLEISCGNSVKLNPVINAQSGAKYAVKYTSSDSKTVVVNDDGTILGIKEGIVKITCTVSDEYGNSVSDTCTVKVVIFNKKIHSVTVNDISLNYKKSTILQPIIDADSGVKCSVEYQTSNPNIATVDNNGNIYAAKKGNATITCTVTDEYGNTVKDTCTVNINYAWWQWIIKIVLFGWIWY
ncbi:MAG: leucine-rich repeat protein [Ruminococcus sp.]|nr:leucine-rich repeat protein [Candidatus Copronaster equi]